MRRCAKPDERGAQAEAAADRAAVDPAESPAELLLAKAASADASAKAWKRSPEREVALVATFCVTEAIGFNLDSSTGPPGCPPLQVTGKGNKDRAIPIEPALKMLLDRYLQPRIERHGAHSRENQAAPLFLHYDGTRLTRGRIQYEVERVYMGAGLGRRGARRSSGVHAAPHTRLTGNRVRHRRRRAARHPRPRLAGDPPAATSTTTPSDSDKQSKPIPHNAPCGRSADAPTEFLRPRPPPLPTNAAATSAVC